MKKLLTTTACLAALSLPVYAQGFDFKPYIGFDLQRTSYDLKGSSYNIIEPPVDIDALFEENLYGLNIHIGDRFHKNFGVELGYFRTQEESKSTGFESHSITFTLPDGGRSAPLPLKNISTDFESYGITLDGFGYLPLGEQERFELIGTAGLIWSKLRVKGKIELELMGINPVNSSIIISDKYEEVNLRFGVGAQYSFMEKMNLRGLIRYQIADFDDNVDYAWTCTIGLNYSFF